MKKGPLPLAKKESLGQAWLVLGVVQTKGAIIKI